MRKIPKREGKPSELSTVPHHSRITLQIGAQRFALDISCKATRLPSATATSPVIETKFLYLRQPAALVYVPWAGAVMWLSFVNTIPFSQVLFALVLPPAVWCAIRWVIFGRLW